MKNPVYKPVWNRKDKLNPDGTALVQIQVYLKRRYKFFSTGVYISSEQWDPVQWVINRRDAEDLNKKIRLVIHDLEEYEYKARARGDLFELSMLPDSRLPKHDFLNYMAAKIQEEDISSGTRKQHNSTLQHLLDFGKIVYFTDITRQNIEAFDAYLHGLELEQSSIYGQHKRLKKWVRKAIVDGYLAKDPYLLYKIPQGNRNTIKYLDEKDLAKLEDKKINNARLSRIRDVFLFCCYTGLAYQEAADLKAENITKDADGMLWITGDRKKVKGNKQTSATGEYMVPLHDKAVKILNRYKKSRIGYSLPILTNQQYNAMLKEVAILCNIDTHLTTHVARHTFATTFTLAKGISIESVKEMLGHSSIRITEKYAKVLKSRVKEEMRKIF